MAHYAMICVWRQKVTQGNRINVIREENHSQDVAANMEQVSSLIEQNSRPASADFHLTQTKSLPGLGIFHIIQTNV